MKEAWWDDDSEQDDEAWSPPPWVDPDDRLWRHPTELAVQAWPARRNAPSSTSRRWRARGGVAAATVTGVVLSAAGYAIGNHLGSSSSATTRDAFTKSTLAALSTVKDDPASTPPQIAQSIARIQVVTSAGVVTGTAMAFAPGGWFVTASRLLRSAGEEVTIDTMNDSHSSSARQARVVGIDRTTGIAVIRVIPSRAHASTKLVDLPVPSISSTIVQAGEKVTVIGAGPGNRTQYIPATITGTSVDALEPDGTEVLGASRLAVDIGRPVLGSVTLSADGTITGIVTACSSCDDVAAPAGGASPAPSPNGKSASSTIPATASHSLAMQTPDDDVMATPIDLVQNAAREIVQSGKAIHGWLGVQVVDTSTVPPGHGVTVAAVDSSSPAFDDGLLPGDVIVSVDGQPIVSSASLEAQVALREPGTPLVVDVERGGVAEAFVIPLGSAAGGDS